MVVVPAAMAFSETHLITNPDGSVYHLNLRGEHIADRVIVVGDPGRVHRVSSFFDDIEFEMNKREFITHTGYVGSKRITVVSSGMGSDNVEILLTELDAAVNFDLASRTPKEKKRSLRIVRVGTSAAIQEDITLGTHILTEKALGIDTLMHFYEFNRTAEELDLEESLQTYLQLPYRPYCQGASNELLNLFNNSHLMRGNTLTCPGFYAPQGRQLTTPITYPKLVDELMYFRKNDFWITNLEMETAAYYALGRLLGHTVVSLNAIIANRVSQTFAQDPNEIIDALIATAIEKI